MLFSLQKKKKTKKITSLTVYVFKSYLPHHKHTHSAQPALFRTS
jgi:hypothetical protein